MIYVFFYLMAPMLQVAIANGFKVQNMLTLLRLEQFFISFPRASSCCMTVTRSARLL